MLSNRKTLMKSTYSPSTFGLRPSLILSTTSNTLFLQHRQNIRIFISIFVLAFLALSASSISLWVHASISGSLSSQSYLNWDVHFYDADLSTNVSNLVPVHSLQRNTEYLVGIQVIDAATGCPSTPLTRTLQSFGLAPEFVWLTRGALDASDKLKSVLVLSTAALKITSSAAASSSDDDADSSTPTSAAYRASMRFVNNAWFLYVITPATLNRVDILIKSRFVSSANLVIHTEFPPKMSEITQTLFLLEEKKTFQNILANYVLEKQVYPHSNITFAEAGKILSLSDAYATTLISIVAEDRKMPIAGSLNSDEWALAALLRKAKQYKSSSESELFTTGTTTTPTTSNAASSSSPFDLDLSEVWSMIANKDSRHQCSRIGALDVSVADTIVSVSISSFIKLHRVSNESIAHVNMLAPTIMSMPPNVYINSFQVRTNIDVSPQSTIAVLNTNSTIVMFTEDEWETSVMLDFEPVLDTLATAEPISRTFNSTQETPILPSNIALNGIRDAISFFNRTLLLTGRGVYEGIPVELLPSSSTTSASDACPLLDPEGYNKGSYTFSSMSFTSPSSPFRCMNWTLALEGFVDKLAISSQYAPSHLVDQQFGNMDEFVVAIVNSPFPPRMMASVGHRRPFTILVDSEGQHVTDFVARIRSNWTNSQPMPTLAGTTGWIYPAESKLATIIDVAWSVMNQGAIFVLVDSIGNAKNESLFNTTSGTIRSRYGLYVLKNVRINRYLKYPLTFPFIEPYVLPSGLDTSKASWIETSLIPLRVIRSGRQSEAWSSYRSVLNMFNSPQQFAKLEQESTQVVLTDMKFCRCATPILFIWGSALLSTANFGASVKVLYSFPASDETSITLKQSNPDAIPMVTAFTSACYGDGAFAFVSNTGHVYFGHPFVGRTILLTSINPIPTAASIFGVNAALSQASNSASSTTTIGSYVFFSFSDRLVRVVISSSKQGTVVTPILQRTTTLIDAAYDELRSQGAFDAVDIGTCPLSEFDIVSSKHYNYTRFPTSGVAHMDTITGLPRRIILGFNDTYTWLIRLVQTTKGDELYTRTSSSASFIFPEPNFSLDGSYVISSGQGSKGLPSLMAQSYIMGSDFNIYYDDDKDAVSTSFPSSYSAFEYIPRPSQKTSESGIPRKHVQLETAVYNIIDSPDAQSSLLIQTVSDLALKRDLRKRAESGSRLIPSSVRLLFPSFSNSWACFPLFVSLVQSRASKTCIPQRTMSPSPSVSTLSSSATQSCSTTASSSSALASASSYKLAVVLSAVAAAAPQMEVWSGCPPFLRLMYDPVIARAWANETCNERDGIPCSTFSNSFIFPLFIVDDLDGSKRQYTGDYTVLLVAGGETLDSMHVFNAYEADQYNNQRDKAIWSTLEDLSNRDVLPVGAENTWACSTGSPCKRVFPREFQGSGSSGPPEYFVRFLITTRRSTDTSLDEESSVRDFGNDLGYCDLTTVVTMRIHSIPLDDAVAFIILWVTFGTVILFVVVLFLIKYKGYSQFAERLRVEHEKMLEEESDEEYSDSSYDDYSSDFGSSEFEQGSMYSDDDDDGDSADDEESDDVSTSYEYSKSES